MLHSRPYHPQSQGKVERSHRELRNKLHYDMMKLGNRGVNWVENLPNYMRVLNELAREELSWRSPFEIYYGRVSNNVKKASSKSIPKQPSVDKIEVIHPSVKSLQSRSKKMIKMRGLARKAGQRLDEQMIKKHNRRHKNAQYNKHDTVLARITGSKGKLGPKRRHVVKGRIIKKSEHSDNYKVRVTLPSSKEIKELWFSIEDITHL